MRRATLRDLRNRFARILTWIEEGERVKVTSRGRVVATLVPERRKARRVSWPDFLARLRTDWPRGLKGKSIGELIAEERAGAGRRRAGIATGQAAPGYRRRCRSSSAVVLQ